MLISGGGTTLKNLIEQIDQGRLNARIMLVISSSGKAKGIEFAEQAGIETKVMERSKFESPEAYRDAIFDTSRKSGVELAVMAGFLKHLLIPDDFENRVVNIHPSLIPAFCGAGFYGLRVHQAVLSQGCKVSGCTIHFVDNQYDHGPIIAQRSVPVLENDSAESLARRVFEQECKIYPEVIQWIADGRVRVIGNRVAIQET